MSKKLDAFAHMVLYIAIAVGIAAIFASKSDPIRLFLVLIMLVLYYLVWGFTYHHYKKDLSSKLFIEYLLIAGIALGAGYLVLVG